MDGILIRERYKVVQVLWRAENYAAVEVVDIQERENPSLLVNLYGGELLHRYGEIYAGMKDCPAFRGMFLEDGALAAVFQPPGQGPIHERENHRLFRRVQAVHCPGERDGYGRGRHYRRRLLLHHHLPHQ